jgi:cupin superfamily acireductone dioxygenase involved in methionine salvage
MTSARRFQLDEVTLRPGTYFNPQTEIMIVVDDSPEVDHEIFESDEFESSDWVLIAEDIPVDENKRDELVERFQRTHQAGEDDLLSDLDEDPDEDDEDDEDDELDGVDDLEFEHE